jgi:hypothetical protein
MRFRATEPTRGGTLLVRPRCLRQATIAFAALVLLSFIVSGLTLSGITAARGRLLVTDAGGLIGTGVILGAAALTPLRISVRADADGIRIRNLASAYDCTWSMIRAVRYQRGVPWVTVELTNDEQVPILAVQISDGDRALEAIRALRALHAAATESGQA